jgi:cell division protein FtsN
MWTVQVAAYNTKSAADALVKSLKDRGVEARTFGTIAPFRVRVGRYDTRAKAESASQKMNAKKITGFVTEAEPQ